MTASRVVLLSFVLLTAVYLTWHVTSSAGDPGIRSSRLEEPLPSRPTPIQLRSSADCQQCHAEIYAEWASSHHKIAYTNPEVQRNSRGFQDRDCLPCHLPRPIFETGFGVRALERQSRFEEGVDCMTCHHYPAGNVMIAAGPLTDAAASAPCQPAEHPAAKDIGLCWPCHNQHKVHDEWSQTEFAVPGLGFKDCNDCHMPEVVRRFGTRKVGRSHAFAAAHDKDALKSAATVTVTKVGPRQLEIIVKNTGAGHNFPTDERHRAVDLDLSVASTEGSVAVVRLDRFRNPYRTEFELKNPLREPGASRDYRLPLGSSGDLSVTALRVPAEFRPDRTTVYPESTQIPAGEARRYTVDFPSTAREVTVHLRYRIQPFQSDEEATLLYEETLQLD